MEFKPLYLKLFLGLRPKYPVHSCANAKVTPRYVDKDRGWYHTTYL